MPRQPSIKTLKILFAQSRNQCAAPGCENPIIAEATALDRAAPVAQIAHIVARSPEGPRADPSFPPDRINDESNLILLCAHHHAVADAQDSTYTAEELRRWKAAHSSTVHGNGRGTDPRHGRRAGVRQWLANLPAEILYALAGTLALAAIAGLGTAVWGLLTDNERSEPRAAALLVLDRSPSFRASTPSCVSDFMTVARAVAARGGDLYAGAFLGADPYAQPAGVEVHFDEEVPDRGNASLTRESRLAAAERLRPGFEQLTRNPSPRGTPRRGGSPVLETLERASDFHTQRILATSEFSLVVCTDLVAIGDGLDAFTPISDRTVERLLYLWAPRVAGLRGTTWYFVGVGRTVIDPRNRRQVARLMRELAKRIGARVALIDTALGARFPIAR